MPLVIPGITSGTSNPTEEWQSKLLGKKLGDQHDEINFAKKDLPQQHRVVGQGDMMTMDNDPKRLNIHVGDDGTVSKVTHG